MRTFLSLSLLTLIIASAAIADPADPIPCRERQAKVDAPTRVNVAYGRQGGDTIADATPIPSLPFADSGATCGAADDYAADCVSDRGAPDVVYSFVPSTAMSITIDLCGSAYDTGLYVYDASLNVIACNDDVCGAQSRLRNLEVHRGETYYFIVDGYGDDCGTYTLTVAEYVPCTLVCPPGSALEGEPPLEINYEDYYNDGCCGGHGEVFQNLWGLANGTRTFCARTGWFTYSGSSFRDTDWFVATFGPTGVIEVTGDAEYETYLFELGGDCSSGVTVVQLATLGQCTEGSLTVTGEPGSTVWLWTGPTVFEPENGSSLLEYGYVLRFTGMASSGLTGVGDGPVVEPSTWSEVKSLYH